MNGLINLIIAVLVAAIFSGILGSLWYGPFFGKTWMQLSKIKKPKKITSEIKKMMLKSYSLMFVSSIVTSIILYLFLVLIVSIWYALLMAVLIWLGFFVTTLLGSVLWEGKPFKLYLINIAYHLVNLVGMTIILYYI